MKFVLNAIKHEDVRQQIIEYLKSNSEYSATFDWTASNISYIIDTMAFVSMMMSYQISNVANNNFLESCNFRKNAVAHAKEIGYRPMRKVSSQVVGTISYVDEGTTFVSSSILKINPRSRFVSNKGNIFYNKEEILLTYVSPSTLQGNFTLYEGLERSITYDGTGEKNKFQSFLIQSDSVEENSLSMTVRNNLTSSLEEDWFEARNIFHITSKKIFFVEEDSANEFMPRITFGDGIIGTALSEYQVATLNYIETKGAAANGEYIVSSIFESSNVDVSKVEVLGFTLSLSNFAGLSDSTNTSFGGRDNETMTEIQDKAPKYYSMTGRGVTEKDFISILNSYPYVMTSNVIGGNDLFPTVSTELGNIYVTGVPFLDKDSFLTTDKLYLTPNEEDTLRVELEKYNIVSTKLNFFKPSYILVNVQPTVELDRNIPSVSETRVKNLAKQDLIDYTTTNFFDFATYFRASKLTAVMDAYPEVISSRINPTFYFLINQDSFYPEGQSFDNFINLPVIQNTSDVVDAATYKSFIKTNTERRSDLNLEETDVLAISDRTLYGPLLNDYSLRELYNDDVSGSLLSNVLINGETQIFSFFKYPDNTKIPEKYNVRSSKYEITSNDISAGKESLNLEIDIDGLKLIGTIFRTENPFFSALVSNESEFPTASDNLIVECVKAISVSGNDKNFSFMNVGEFAIFNGETNLWEKTTDKGTVSAIDSDGLYGDEQTNGIYSISAYGDGGGLIDFPVGTSDFIIFNPSSTAEKWQKLNHRNDINPMFDSTFNLPKEAKNLSLKLAVTNEGTSGNFLGRSANWFENNDLMFYNEENDFEWVKLVNIGSSAEMTALSEIDAAGTDLFYKSYSGTGPEVIGNMLRVTGYGNFSLYENIVWPEGSDKIAYEDDILVYTGVSGQSEGQWTIFQKILTYQFVVDPFVASDLPLPMAFGDFFEVISSAVDEEEAISIAANFNGDTVDYYANGDRIVYLGDALWKKLEPIDSVDASTSSGFPLVAGIGDVLTVIEDGYFYIDGVDGATTPYINSTPGRPYVDGDKIIFVSTASGGKWYHLNEYSFQYNDEVTTAKEKLNSIGFNSMFFYKYNNDSRFYDVYFNDLYHGCLVGDFEYEQLDSSVNSSNVGKIIFQSYVNGNYNSTEQTPPLETKALFAPSNSFDMIQIISRNKVDSAGTIILDQEEDFDTRFNQFLAVNIEDVQKL